MRLRLNGWQRLWVIFSALYLILVVGMTISFWPTFETTRHRDEFITQMPAELRARVRSAYGSTWEREEASKQSNVVWDDAKTQVPKGKSKPMPPPPDVVVSSNEFPNGAMLDIRVAKEGDTKSNDDVALAYWAVVESAARAERWQRVWQMALVWLIPCLTLYTLGWAIGWVRRGFTSDTASGPKGK